jgi:topoisomerase-4 subunit A
MPLKFKFKTKDEIPAEHLPFYAERDGAWVLDAEGAVEKAKLDELLGDEKAQWKSISAQIRDVKKTFSQETNIGRRRSTFDTPPETADIDLTEAMVEREPLTVVVTEKGWIRALKGHQQDLSSLQFKGDDGLKFSFFTETTAKLLMMMTDGKVFTLEASKLPGGRGFGWRPPLAARSRIGTWVRCR